MKRTKENADRRLDALQDLAAAEKSAREWMANATGIDSILAEHIHAKMADLLNLMERINQEAGR